MDCIFFSVHQSKHYIANISAILAPWAVLQIYFLLLVMRMTLDAISENKHIVIKI